MRRYELFGLSVESAIELPELAPSMREGPADIAVRLGHVAEVEGLVGDHYVHRVPDVAAYRIRDGRSIIVDPHPAADESHVRLFLLGTALGIALHQRGLLPLHANGVEIDGRAILFMGASGAGKSTLASWFVNKGYRLIADDVCAISTAGGRATVLPGIPRFRLWEDALAQQGRTSEGLSLSYAGDENYRKFDVPVDEGSRVRGGLPLGAIYVLQRSAEASITPIAGLAAIEALYAHTYRGEYVALLGLEEAHLRSCTLLAGRIPMFETGRFWDLSAMEDDNVALLRHTTGIAVRKDP